MEMTQEWAEKIWHGGPEAFQIVRELYADMVRKMDGFEQQAKLLLDACEKMPLVWISVEERLPEEDEFVMVGWAGRREIGKGYLLNGKWHDPLVGTPDVNPPTHWMPLPEPPQPSVHIE